MSDSRDIQTIFNEAAERLIRGESLEQVLALYPQDAELLRPLLETVETARRTRIPQAEIDAARDRVRFKISRALEQPIPPQPKLMPRRLPPLAVAGVALILMTVVTLTLIDREQQATIEQLTQTVMPTVTETPSPTHTPTATPSLTPTVTVTPSATLAVPTDEDDGDDDSDEATPRVTFTQQAPVIVVTQAVTASPTPSVTRTPRPTATDDDDDIVTSCGVVVPDEWEDYRLRSGDTLSGLAAATGTTVDELIRVNCITNPRGLLVGDLLYLPDAPSNDDDNGGGDDDNDNGGGNDDDDDDDDDDGDDDGDGDDDD